MSRTLLLLSLIFLAALVLFWVSGRRGDPDGLATAEAQPEASEEAASSSLLEWKEASDGVPAETRVAVAELKAGSSQPAPERATSIEPAPTEGLELHVVEAANGRPIAGAKVLLLAEDALLSEDILRFLAAGLHVDRALSSLGREFRTDESGRLYLPPFRDNGFIAAEGTGHSGHDLFGWRTVEWEETAPARLELTPDPLLRVQVVDSRGRARSGVPVALRLRRDEDHWLDTMTEVTDRRGLASLRHLEQVLEMIGEGSEPMAALSVLLPEPIERALDLESLPEDTIEFVLPPTASLEVQLVDSEGQPSPEPGYVGVRILPRDEDIDADKFFDFGKGVTVQWAPEGETTFPYVPTDVDLAVAMRFEDGRESTVVRVAEPVREGGLARVEIPTLPPVPTVQVRVLRTENEVLASTRVDYFLVEVPADGSRSKEVARGEARTDASGEFRIIPEEEWSAGIRRRLDLFVRDSKSPVPMVAQIDCSVHLPPGTTRLDAILHPVPRVASGYVVDEKGAPIRGARLRLFEPPTGDELGKGRWNRVRSADATSGVHGEFEIHALLESAQLALEARHDLYRAPRRLEFPSGATDLELCMIGVGGLAGRFLLDPGIARPQLGFHLQSRDTNTPATIHQRLLEDGSFELRRIMRGRYDLQIRLKTEGETLITVPELEVRAAETTRDPRLSAIDLRGRLRQLVFTVEGEGGQTIDGMGVAVRRPASENTQWKTWLHPGNELEIFTIEPYLDLEVSAREHRPKRLEQIADSRLVVLQEGLPLNVQLTQRPPPLGRHETLALRLQPSEGSRSWHVGGSTQTQLDARGHGRLAVPDTGRFQVILELQRKGGDRVRVDHARQEADIIETTGEQTFTLEVSREAIRAAQEELESS